MMSENQIKRITPRQLKAEYNSIGILFVIIFVISALLKIGYGFLIPFLQDHLVNVDLTALDQLIRLALTLIVMLIPFAVYAKRKGLRISELFAPVRSEAHAAVTLLIAGLALNLLLTFVTGVISLMLSFTDLKLVMEPMMLEGSLAVRILSIIRSVLVFPLCAEFMFRGVCLKNFSRMGNYFAIIASALLFAVVQGNPVYIVSSFVLGLFLAVVTMRFNSILPALFIHIAINLQTLLLQQIPLKYSWIIGLSCVVIYALAIVLLIRYRHHRIIIKRENDPWILFRYFFTSGWVAATIVLYLFFNRLMMGM